MHAWFKRAIPASLHVLGRALEPGNRRIGTGFDGSSGDLFTKGRIKQLSHVRWSQPAFATLRAIHDTNRTCDWTQI